LAALVRQNDILLDAPRYKALFTIDDVNSNHGEEEEEEEKGETNHFVIFDKQLERSNAVSQARYNEVLLKLKELETEYKNIYTRIQRQSPKLLSDYKQER
jgi:hypothetical protein